MTPRSRRLWLGVAVIGVVLAVVASWLLVRQPSAPRRATFYAPSEWLPKARPRAWKWIVIHHSAAETVDGAKMDLAHRMRGWDELGYHFVINDGSLKPDGFVEVSHRWGVQKQGAHALTADGQYNNFGIGICVVGNLENHPPTAAQRQALVRLIAYLQKRYAIPTSNVIGHNVANPATECPGDHLDLQELRRELAR